MRDSNCNTHTSHVLYVSCVICSLLFISVESPFAEHNEARAMQNYSKKIFRLRSVVIAIAHQTTMTTLLPFYFFSCYSPMRIGMTVMYVCVRKVYFARHDRDIRMSIMHSDALIDPKLDHVPTNVHLKIVTGMNPHKKKPMPPIQFPDVFQRTPSNVSSRLDDRLYLACARECTMVSTLPPIAYSIVYTNKL